MNTELAANREVNETEPKQADDDMLAGPRGSTAAAFETSHKAQVESLGLIPQSEAPHGQDAPPPQRITEEPEETAEKKAAPADAPQPAATRQAVPTLR